MTPANYDISITPRASFRKSFRFRDRRGTPMDLTGFAVDAYIVQGNGIKTQLLFSPTNREQGEFDLILPYTDTENLSNGKWCLYVVNPDATRDLWLTGRCIFRDLNP